MSQERNEKALQEIFKRVSYRDHGPIYDLSYLRPEQGLRTTLERHKRAAEQWLGDVRAQQMPTMGPVHFEYVENLQINAFAFESEDHDFVGVYVGSIATIYSFFGSLLASPRFLQLIGNPLAEEEWNSEIFDANHSFRRPKDAARRSFAHLAATIAIDFLFAHEIGHLMNGHVRLLNRRSGLLLLAEFDTAQRSSEENLALQTLEMDADSFAVVQGLATAIGRAGDPNHIFPVDWRQWYGTPRQALFSWMLAIYGFFRLFFKGTPNLDGLDSTSHPPPNIRLSFALATLLEYLRKKRLDELIPMIEPLLDEVMATVETGHALITSMPVDLGGIQQTLDRRVYDHLGRLLERWRILRPELVPLNRGGRLAD